MIALIAAYSRNRVIGKGGRIPWKIKGEQKRFQELTMGNIVIMGRRTYEEIGKPLPGRDTIVVSNTKIYEGERCTTVGSLEKAVEIAKAVENRDIFIAGGARLYQEAISIVDNMYITEIYADMEGDVLFPEFDKSRFEKAVICHVDGKLPYDYVTYSRKMI